MYLAFFDKLDEAFMTISVYLVNMTKIKNSCSRVAILRDKN